MTMVSMVVDASKVCGICLVWACDIRRLRNTSCGGVVPNIFFTDCVASADHFDSYLLW